MHCAEAPCALACPSNAIKIDAKTGVVLLNEDKCIGCMTCAMVCPFGAIVMHKSNRVALKCDLCVDRQTRGLIPACVEACPTRVLVYAEEDELLKTGRTAAAVKIINAAGEFKQNTTADSPLDRLRKLGDR
jgi:Fe-S-cluster-containing dehydrogenase component